MRLQQWLFSPVLARGDVAATLKADAEKIQADTQTLREDQKREVRTLAHVMGLEKIAAQF